MHKLDLALTADTLESAQTLLSEIGVGNSSIEKVGLLFVASLNLEEELPDEVYDKIAENKNVSVILDSLSQQRGEDVARHLYLIETHLRKLLLYIPDAASSYVRVIAEKASHFGGRATISNEKFLDTITSELTLGQIIEVFQHNIAKDEKESIDWATLFNVLEGVSTLEEFRTKIEQITTPITIWDVIAEHVLTHALQLDDVSAKLKRLKRIRDTAAHFRVITKREVGEALYLSKTLIAGLEIKQQTSHDKAAITDIDIKAAVDIKNKATINGGYPNFLADSPIDTVVDSWGFYNRESTSYAAWKVSEVMGQMPLKDGGNAIQWLAKARVMGLKVTSEPKPLCVAIEPTGYYGHAMWVEEIVDEERIRVSQYNYDWTGTYSEMVRKTHNLFFIYFEPVAYEARILKLQKELDRRSVKPRP